MRRCTVRREVGNRRPRRCASRARLGHNAQRRRLHVVAAHARAGMAERGRCARRTREESQGPARTTDRDSSSSVSGLRSPNARARRSRSCDAIEPRRDRMPLCSDERRSRRGRLRAERSAGGIEQEQESPSIPQRARIGSSPQAPPGPSSANSRPPRSRKWLQRGETRRGELPRRSDHEHGVDVRGHGVERSSGLAAHRVASCRQRCGQPGITHVVAALQVSLALTAQREDLAVARRAQPLQRLEDRALARALRHPMVLPDAPRSRITRLFEPPTP